MKTNQCKTKEKKTLGFIFKILYCFSGLEKTWTSFRTYMSNLKAEDGYAAQSN